MKLKINDLLIELANLHPKYINLSLDRLELLLNKLGNPHFKLPNTIHIAGTNGKGSTLSFIKNILIKNGYSCHTYTSPHLSNFKERIVIKNNEVSSKKLYECLKYVKKINQNNQITFFEITTAAAFLLFAETKADFLILETGLGGRLDATNIIPKKILSIITPISMDHEEFLGNTITKITKEKLGITKKSKKIIIAKQTSEVKKIIIKKLKIKKNVYYYKKDYEPLNKNSSKFLFKFKNKKIIFDKPKLLGDHQVENASTAIASTLILKHLGYKINNKLISKGVKETSWPGRLELINYNNKKIILDGSHNISGSKKLNLFLKQKKIKPIVLFGMLNNKRIFEFLKILRKNVKEIVPIQIPYEKNAFTEKQIKYYCDKLSIKFTEIDNYDQKLKYILNSSKKYILVTGSLYLVGKIRNKFL